MATSYSLWHTRVIQFIICFSNTHVTGSLLSAEGESLLRDTSNFVTKNDWVGSRFSCNLWKKLIAVKWPCIVEGCNPARWRCVTYKPTVLQGIGNVRGELVWSVTNFEKCFQAFWYCFKVEGLTHILIRLFICAWSLPVVDAEGPLQVVVASRNSQGDEALPENGTKRQRDSLIYLVHEWLWIWYYTASLSEQGVLWASWFLDLYRFACLSHTQLLGCHSWNWHIYLPSRFQKSEWRWWLDKIQEKLYFLFSNHPETQWRTIFCQKWQHMPFYLHPWTGWVTAKNVLWLIETEFSHCGIWKINTTFWYQHELRHWQWRSEKVFWLQWWCL